MDERCQFILDEAVNIGSFTELCARYGISTKTGYKWLKRYRTGGMAYLQDQSRARKHHPNEISPEVKRTILEMRQEHVTYGPKKLRIKLLEKDSKQPWPALSTIGAILKANGLSVQRKRRRHATPSTQPFADCNASNRAWCADYKGWFRTGDGCRCDPLTISDGFSRYLLRCHIVEAESYGYARGVFEAAFREYGMPDAIRTDNGPPFATTGLGGLSRLSVWWLRLGIEPQRIEPGEPQQNGRHERMHLTLKQETARPPAQTLRAQQRRFDAFCREYNYERPHEALGMKTPALLYQPSPRAYPARLPEMGYGRGMEVRRVIHGEFRWDGSRIFLTHSLNDELIGLQCCDDRYWRIYFGTLPLAILDSFEHRLLNARQAKRLERANSYGIEYEI
jgi:transposase InsO family protein